MQSTEKKKTPKQARGGSAASARSARQLKNGSFAVVFCAIAIVLVIFVNLIVGALPTSITQFDLTSNQLYTLSEQSTALVGAIDQDVTLYHVTTDSQKDNTIDRLLHNYAEVSDHIRVVQIDPTTNPYFISNYTDESVSINTVVVESALRSYVVDYNDIYQNSYNYDMTSGGYTTTTNFDGENQITGAIDYVLSDTMPTVYVLDGNGESALSSEMESSVKRQNITLSTLNLLTETQIPEDAAALIMVSPTSDITDAQYDMLLSYLENGGRLLLFTDYQNGLLPRLNDLMANYGVQASNSMVIEADSNYYFPSYPYYLFPQCQEHQITTGLVGNGRYVMLPLSHIIKPLDSYRSSLVLEPLLTTSESAFAKIDVQTLEKEAGDEEGPFTVGMAISEVVDETETRIVWYPTSLLMASDIDTAVSGSNSVLVLNSLSWLLGEETSGVVIDAKALSAQRLTVTASQVVMWAVILLIVVPVVCIVAGIVIFLLRRKR